MTNELSDELGDGRVRNLLRNVEYYVGHEMTKYEGWLSVRDVVRKKIFRRSGSAKPHGWQVTIRGSFKSHVRDKNETGYLLFPRGKGYLVPLREINNFVMRCDSSALDRDTVDIFFNVDEQANVVIRFHDNEMPVSQFSLS